MRELLISSLLVVAGCGGSDDPAATDETIEHGLPPCSEVYYDGAPVTGAVTDGSCVDREGTLQFVGSSRYTCPDGSEIGWNNLGWWADGVVHLHAPDAAELVAPADVRDRCDRPLVP